MVETVVFHRSKAIWVKSSNRGIQVQIKTQSLNQMKIKFLQQQFNLEQLNNEELVKFTSNPEYANKFLCFANYADGSDPLTTKDLVKLQSDDLQSISLLPSHYIRFTFEHTIWIDQETQH